MKDDDSFRFVFDEDLQYLTKDYYVILFILLTPLSSRKFTMTVQKYFK